MNCLAAFNHRLFSSELQDESALAKSFDQANKGQGQGLTAFDILSDNRTSKTEKYPNTKRKRSEKEPKRLCPIQPKKHIKQNYETPEKLQNFLKRKNTHTPIDANTVYPSAPMYIEDIIIRDTDRSKMQTPTTSLPGSQSLNSYNEHETFGNSLHFQLTPFSSTDSSTSQKYEKEYKNYGNHLKSAKQDPCGKIPCPTYTKTNKSNSTSPKEKVVIIYDDDEVRDYLYVFGSRSQHKKQDYSAVAKKKTFQSNNFSNFPLLKTLMDPHYIPKTAEERSLCIQLLEEVLNT
ncbi:meiotic double-strand break formation protrin Mde2 [Schizosaccharomyces osmophilus]|uniref:Meiotic double-strand break formation protrin Mde2 n=1 Tax=Schizosaccharomyces osmophilus TaxID=2545709 RepID=A0AAF0AVV6_9SCHI|nr:meiotic double-strand break formation protrin Mde2 [Schizosaccharomyces osmophilus]WBW72334.1 meiotic double-strand break formation protrin Mde2 [Schizosaccharomyces osmophilus]